MFKYFQSILRFVGGELFDTRCYLCERRINELVVCRGCLFLSPCQDDITLPEIPRVRSAFWLDEKGLDLVRRTKYHGERKYFEVFREFSQLPGELEKGALLIPVPTSFERFQSLGFNQSWFLCRWISENQGLPLLLDGLLKIKDTLPQSTLSKKKRRTNLKSAFQWNFEYPVPEKVILIDDILTTGATLSACAKAIKRIGVREVSAWTLFRTPMSKSQVER